MKPPAGFAVEIRARPPAPPGMERRQPSRLIAAWTEDGCYCFTSITVREAKRMISRGEATADLGAAVVMEGL